jgi:hypothetical protein
MDKLKGGRYVFNVDVRKIAIHPRTNVIEAAIRAYKIGAHLETRDGVVSYAPGRDVLQYAKALKARSLRRLAAAIRG